MQKDICILANSRKKGGFCVAGKDVTTNEWVRIVGDSNGTELSLTQIAYSDTMGQVHRTPYEPFNKFLRIDLGQCVPLNYQPENILVTPTRWQQVHISEPNINLDTPPDLWGNGDRIKALDIKQGRIIISQSLYWIKVNNLQFYVNDFNTNRAYFQYGGIDYDLGATMNPVIFQSLLNGTMLHNDIITVSLAGAFFNNYSGQCEHYKLVAAVF
ncbi:MAG: hypothetical protein LBG80_20445 [Bacteroidales bacterium]|jgi:hypothetical protein|nr:hypothetical protein [Bacteroidales bacterium]